MTKINTEELELDALIEYMYQHEEDVSNTQLKYIALYATSEDSEHAMYILTNKRK